MCGRYTLQTGMEDLRTRFNFDSKQMESRPHYNIAPSDNILAVIHQAGEQEGRTAAEMSWGLIPHWTKDTGKAMINARAETLAQKTSFKDPYMKRRCLILADGFFEWKRTPKGKEPMWITLESGHAFAMAGIWQPWKTPGRNVVIMTCAIITVPPNEVMRPIHDRMPAILTQEAIEVWLDPQTTPGPALRSLLAPFQTEDMKSHRVSKLVNNTRNDIPQLVAPLG